MINHCINHPDRPPFVEFKGKQICAECYYGYDKFKKKYKEEPEKWYERFKK